MLVMVMVNILRILLQVLKSNGQLSREFYATPWKYKQTSHYLEIDTNGLNVIKGREGVYLVPNESSLDITNRIVNYGEN